METPVVQEPRKKTRLWVTLGIVAFLVLILVMVLIAVLSPKHYGLREAAIESISIYGYPSEDGSSAVELKRLDKKDWKAFLKDMNALTITVEKPTSADTANQWLHVVMKNGNVKEIYPYLLVIFDMDTDGTVHGITNKYYRVDKKALYAIYRTYGLM